MSCDDVFVEYFLELLSPLSDSSEISRKRMFGGVGFFADGLMFALVAESTLYLKVDDDNREEFESRDLEPFIFEKTNKNVVMSYYQSPEEALDNAASMCEWAQSGIQAAQRTHQKKASNKTNGSRGRDTSARRSASAAKALEEDIESMVADADGGTDGDDLFSNNL